MSYLSCSDADRYGNNYRKLDLMSQFKIIAKRLTRIVCCLIYYLVLQWLPSSSCRVIGPWCRWLRFQICRHIFESCGRNVNVEHKSRFAGGSKLRIGHNSGIGVNCRVPFNITIGNDVMMAPDVLIIGMNHQFDDTGIPMIKQGFSEVRPVTIGDDVWIGSRVIILPGIKIGNGAIIGAGAIVTRDVLDYDIVAGNPARVIRSRLTNKR